MSPDVLVVAQGGKAVPVGVPGIGKDIVLTRSDAESILGGRPSSKSGLLRRFVSFAAALFVRFFYDPGLLRWLLRGPFPFKKRVSILGGGFAGVELGETLLHSGKKVAIVEASKRMGYDIDIIHRWVFLKSLIVCRSASVARSAVMPAPSESILTRTSNSSSTFEGSTSIMSWIGSWMF